MTQARSTSEDGFTLVELMVSMVLLVVVSAVSIAAVNLMFKDVRLQQAQSDNLDGGRKAVAVMDRQVRYADFINPPGATADGSQWVEWRQSSVDPSDAPTCYQWRWDKPSAQLLFRSWQQVSDASVKNVTSWNPRATGVGPLTVGGVTRSIFALPAATDPATGALKRTQLTLSFLSTHGSPKFSTDTQVTLTALNTSTSGLSSAAPVCQGKARTP